MRFSILALACFLQSSAALSADPAPPSACQAYVGQQVTVQPFGDVVARLSKIPSQKDEYETTAAFEARQTAVKADLPPTFTIGIQMDTQFLKYDADQGILRVSAYAFDNKNVDFTSVFGYSSPFYGKVKASGFFNIDLVAEQTESPTGSYKGSNAYGASREVTQISRKTSAIWEREARSDEKLFIGQQSGTEALIGSNPMPIEVAKALKAKAKAAVVVAPKWPYFAKGTREWTPTISRPTHVTNEISTIVGDIQAVLMLSPENTVLACFPTL